jgi:hypothetical protein
MESSGIQWNPEIPIGLQWIPLDSTRFRWSPVESSGKAWGGRGVVRQWSSAPLCSCRRGKPHPSSTLQAVARRRGGGCRGARHCRTALVHPPSTRRAVACWHGVVLGLCLLASSSSSFPVARVVVVPPRPTHELLLMRLGVGGVASFVVLLPCCCRPSSSLPFHPRSTPRAVARGAGGGWCVIRCVVLVLVSLGVTRPVAPEPPCEQVPTIPPASSHSQRGGGC